MHIKNWTLAIILVASTSAAKAECTGGDCQPGTIAGPYSSTQVAEHTTTGAFSICQSPSCTGGSWSGDQIEGIDAQQDIGGHYQFYDQGTLNIDDNVAVGANVSGKNAQVLEWVNGSFVQAFDKVTGQPIFTSVGGVIAVPANVAALWSRATQPECADESSGNVQVIFDRLDNSFVINRRVTYMNGAGIHEYAWCIAQLGQRPVRSKHSMVLLRISGEHSDPVYAGLGKLHKRYVLLLLPGLAKNRDLVEWPLYYLRSTRPEHRLRFVWF